MNACAESHLVINEVRHGFLKSKTDVKMYKHNLRRLQTLHIWKLVLVDIAITFNALLCRFVYWNQLFIFIWSKSLSIACSSWLTKGWQFVNVTCLPPCPLQYGHAFSHWPCYTIPMNFKDLIRVARTVIPEARLITRSYINVYSCPCRYTIYTWTVSLAGF